MLVDILKICFDCLTFQLAYSHREARKGGLLVRCHHSAATLGELNRFTIEFEFEPSTRLDSKFELNCPKNERVLIPLLLMLDESIDKVLASSDCGNQICLSRKLKCHQAY